MEAERSHVLLSDINRVVGTNWRLLATYHSLIKPQGRGMLDKWQGRYKGNGG